MTDPTAEAYAAPREMTLAGLLGRGPAAIDEGGAERWIAAAAAGAYMLEAPGARLALEPGERYGVMRGIAVVPVRGILTPNSTMLERYFGWATYAGLTETAEALESDEDVSAVVLEIDSPGGAVLGLEGAVAAIGALAAVKPVLALAAPFAASAAYWIASEATEIVMTPGAEVGSIGTMMQTADPVGPSSDGWQATILRSRHAMGKAPDLTTDEGRVLAQIRLDALEAQFHAGVAEARGIALADLPGILSADADPRHGGACYSASDAIARGLADRVMTRSAFYVETFGTYGAAGRPAPRRMARAAAAKARVAAAKSA